MKKKLFPVVVCFALVVPGVAAEKKSKKSPETPKAATIVMPSSPEAVTHSTATAGLITTELSGKDVQFFKTALAAGHLQAHLVDLVKTKGEAEPIKAVGAALAATQTEENKQLERLASLKGLRVSAEPTAEQKKIDVELEQLSGSNFDKAAMDAIIAASRQSIDAYDIAAQSGDGDIKAFSEQMLPIAREKLRLTEKMTGAGSKAASQLFRTGAPAKAGAAVTPAPSTPAPSTPARAATPKPTTTPKAVATPKPTATSSAKPVATPAAPVATPLPTPAKPAVATPPASIPVATPPPLSIPTKPIPPPITK